MKYNVDGQISLFEVIEEPKPKAKQNKPKVEMYPFQCNIWTRYVTVYAQHERQAYAKCKNMYGCCIGTPVQIG